MNKLSEQLNKLAEIDITRCLEVASLVLENQAKRNCPVGDGVLRNSITHEVGNAENNVIEARVGSNLDYAPYVEHGTGIFAQAGNGRQDRWCYQTPDGEWHSTVGQHPQPFLQNALNETRQDIIDTLSQQVKEALHD